VDVVVYKVKSLTLIKTFNKRAKLIERLPKRDLDRPGLTVGELLSTHFPMPSSSLGPTIRNGTDNYPILTLYLTYRNWDQYDGLEPDELYRDTMVAAQRGEGDTEPTMIASVGNSHQLSPSASPLSASEEAISISSEPDSLPSEAHDSEDDCAIDLTRHQSSSRSPELPELQTPRDLEKLKKVSNDSDRFVAIFFINSYIFLYRDRGMS